MSQVQSELVVSEELIAAIARSEEQFCLEIRKCDPLETVEEYMTGYKGAFYHIQPFLDSFAQQPKILEIGSGNGFGLCYLLKQGLNVVGVEPGEQTYEGRFKRALDLLELNGIRGANSHLLPSPAEKLPFEDGTFDLVFSIAVLEHVRDVEQSMREALRVTKADGLVVMNVPNYNAFREGHYNILWLPYILSGKKIAKWYVRTFYGRPDYFIDELNFTTPGFFRRLRKSLKVCGEMKIFYFCASPFLGLSDRHYLRGLELMRAGDKRYKYLSQRETNIFRNIRTLRGRAWYGLYLAGKALGFIFTGWFLKLLSLLGLAPIFNVVCSRRAATDINASSAVK